MATKLGLLTSSRIAVLPSAHTEEEKIEKQLDRYSEQDLFETLLMVDYLQFKARRKKDTNYIWMMRLEVYERRLQQRLPETKRQKWMIKLGLKTAFDAQSHAKKLLFLWFQ